ncbi:Larval cuticle protein A1A, partial [Habropoda laboriosa]
FQLIVLLSLAVLSKGAVVPAVPAAPVVAPARLEVLDAAPQYSFAYDVQDAVTGDSKAQYETRNGDVVQGSYSLIEADGTRRIVEYTADPINGFNAVVSREPATAVAAIAAPLVPYAPAIAPSAAAAPILPAAAAPVPAIPASAAQAITNYATYPNPYAYTAAYSSPLAYAAPISGLTYAPATALL